MFSDFEERQGDSRVVDACDHGVEAFAQEVQVLADEVEAAGHRQQVDLGARVGDEDVAPGEESQVLLQDAVVDFEPGGVRFRVRRHGLRREDAVEGIAQVVADDVVAVEVIAECLAREGFVAPVEG